MRRTAALTAALRRIKIGFDSIQGNSTATAELLICFDAADGTGFIKDVKVRQNQSGSVRFITGYLTQTGNSFVVRDVSGAFSTVAGVNILPVNLAVVQGDMIAVYTVSGDPRVQVLSGFGGAFGYTAASALSTVPTIGQVIPIIVSTGALLILSSGY